jgi:hypothetical protein
VQQAGRFALLPLLMAACGSSAPSTGAVPVPSSARVQLPTLELRGTYFVPAALAEPAPPLPPAAQRTVAEQRRRFAQARGAAARLAEGETLAALLWRSDAPARPGSRTEALAVLRELTRGAAAESTLERLAQAEIAVGDPDRGLATLGRLLARFPRSRAAPRWRAEVAFEHLRKGEDFQASQAIDAVAVAGAGAGAEAGAGAASGAGATDAPEVAYVRAWLAFRAADLPGARQAMALAASRWPDDPSAPLVWQEYTLFSARDGADAAATASALVEAARKEQESGVTLLGRLADAYLWAGEYPRRAEVLDLMARAGGLETLALVRFYQSDVEHRLGRPEGAARRLLESWAEAEAEVVSHGEPPRQPASEVAERMYQLAALYHHVYATNLDARFGEAARTLFAAYLAIQPPAAHAADARARAADLATLLGGKARAPGPRDGEDVGHVVQARKEELCACYERQLQGDAHLVGTVSLSFDVDPAGRVVSVATHPAPGDAGIAAVAGCVVERVKGWSLSRRARPGTTHVQVDLRLARRNP